MAGRDIVVMGGSAGAYRPMRTLTAALPESLPVAIFVAFHHPAGYVDPFDPTLPRSAWNPTRYAADGDEIAPGRLFVAPFDRNMSIERGRVRIEASPKESFHRPIINLLFRSAAAAYGRRVIGVILSGEGGDGAAGLWEIKRHGGVTIVQDPESAGFSGMSEAALNQVDVDYCVRLGEIPDLLWSLASARPAAPPMTGPRPARVVIVEDEGIVTLNLRRILKKLGYDVVASVRTGEDAIRVVGETLPDVVLMDIRLPGKMDGTAAAGALGTKLQIPVVYVTAYADDQTIEQVKRTDPYGYILKPFRAREVHAAIQLALERRERELAATREP